MTAARAGEAKPDTQKSGMSNAAEIVWKMAYLGMESFLWDVVHTIQIADDMAVCTENLVRVDEVMEPPKLGE